MKGEQCGLTPLSILANSEQMDFPRNLVFAAVALIS
jgi:hypothetical protein